MDFLTLSQPSKWSLGSTHKLDDKKTIKVQKISHFTTFSLSSLILDEDLGDFGEFQLKIWKFIQRAIEDPR
ncbi:hypothetical protein Scep_021334 [Stephania cephalantha]|uniref:Uncharacterized protein n=1 Tax=Stephania cephalantha TaxID=152367 RepID=A0AAP0I1E8_9MAGN